MKDLHQRVVKLNFLAQLEASTYILIHDHPPRGFSGLVQPNGIGRMHVKVPLAAAKGSWMILERIHVTCYSIYIPHISLSSHGGLQFLLRKSNQHYSNH